MKGILVDISPDALAHWALAGMGGLNFWALMAREAERARRDRWMRTHLAAHVRAP